MERTTVNNMGCNQIIDCENETCKETCEKHDCESCPISKAIDKLAAYEDTGITPEQIYDLDRMYQEKCEEVASLEKQLPPCKVGDTIWDIDSGVPCDYEVTGFSFGNLNEELDEDEEIGTDKIIAYYKRGNGSITGSFAVDEIGKTVFLSLEEAKESIRKIVEK